jgi:hypothetical protein
MPFSIRPFRRFPTQCAITMTKFLVLLVAWSLPNITIASEDIVSLIGDRQYWQTFQWDKAENSTIWNLQGWENYEGKQDSNKTFVKERTVFLLGIDFNANQIKENPPAKMSWVLSISSIKTSAENCEQIVSWGTSRFGSPNSLDTSYEIAFGSSPESQLDNIEKVYEWIVGPTRINVLCGGVAPKISQRDSTPSLATIISFAHHTNGKPVIPLFALKCSGKITAFADSSTTELRPFTIVVDTHWGRVRNLKNVPYGKRSSVTPEVISYTLEGDGVVGDFRIDRLTGELYGEFRNSKSNRLQTKLSGECEKVTVMGPKF